MRFIWILVCVCSSAFADCGDHLTPNLQNALHRAEALSPEFSGAGSAEELFLRLLEPTAPAPDLRQSQRDHYAVENMTDAELVQFYDNAIRGLKARVAQIWREEEIRRLAGKLTPRLESVATRILDTYFSPVGLNDNLSPDQAEDYFAKRPWKFFPWAEALAALADFNGDFYSFSAPQLTPEDNRRVQLALAASGRVGDCCLSHQGCTRCPLNRASLRRGH
jgi:hypothetical protein